jgi:prevent-host-death family protein
MRTWQVQEARRQFRQLFDDALAKGPQKIARHGQSAVIVLSEEEWTRLSEAVPSFGELLASCPIDREDLLSRRPARALRQQIFE